MSFNAFLVNMQRPGLHMICMGHSCVQSVFWSNTWEGKLRYDASTKCVYSVQHLQHGNIPTGVDGDAKGELDDTKATSIHN